MQLVGIAHSESVAADCSIEVSATDRFSWRLAFQPSGGFPADATARLKNPKTLQPSFDAGMVPGTYVAVFTAHFLSSTRTWTLRIEVLRTERSFYPIGPMGEVLDVNTYLPTGRVRAIAFDPADPAVMYAGGDRGGVWKSLERGDRWFPVADHKSFPTLSVTALAVGRDRVVYAGLAKGIQRSTDGGITWSPAGNTTANCPNGSFAFNSSTSRIAVHPTNASTVYAATDKGLLRSDTRGQCWHKLPISSDPDTPATDVALDPQTPETVYVGVPSLGGIAKTTDASANPPTFKPIPNLPVQPGSSLVLIAVAPSKPSTIYAMLSNSTRVQLIRSTDSGANWQNGDWPVDPVNCGSQNETQCDRNVAIAVSPADPTRVVLADLFGGTSTARTFSGAQNTWRLILGGHADHFALVFAPDDPTLLYAANDGGIWRARVVLNDAAPLSQWEPRHTGLAVSEVDQVAVVPTNSLTSPFTYVAGIGLQDNGTQVRQRGRTWAPSGGGDGQAVAYDANVTAGNIFYHAANVSDGLAFLREPGGVTLGSGVFAANPYRGGELFGMATPIDNKLYVVENADKINTVDWVCADPDPFSSAGVQWPTIEMGASGVFYVGKTDGTLWSFTLPQVPIGGACQSGTSAKQQAVIYRTAQNDALAVSVDPFNPKSLYIVAAGVSGASRIVHLVRQCRWFNPWMNPYNAIPIAAGLPAELDFGFEGGHFPAIGDPLSPDRVFVGTTTGLWQGLLQGNTYVWSLDPDVPETTIRGIVPQRNRDGYSGALRMATYGRGVWESMPNPPICNGNCISPNLTCVSCNSDAFGVAAETVDVASNGGAWFAIPYSLRSNPRQLIMRVAPIAGGVESPYFISQSRQLTVRNGIEHLHVLFAADDAPLGVHTDAVRVEIAPDEGGSSRAQPIASQTVAFDKWWVQPEARLLSMAADVTDRTTTTAVSAPISVSVSGAPAQAVATPGSLPVALGTSLALSAPALGAMQFQYWSINGVARTSANPRIEVVGNTRVTAHYKAGPRGDRGEQDAEHQ